MLAHSSRGPSGGVGRCVAARGPLLSRIHNRLDERSDDRRHAPCAPEVPIMKSAARSVMIRPALNPAATPGWHARRTRGSARQS